MTLAARPLPPRTLPSRGLPGAAASAPTNASLLRRTDVGRSAALFELELDQALAGYRAGQYVALGLRRDAGYVTRPYSIVALSGDQTRLELLVRHIAGGALTPGLWVQPVAARVRIGPPRGLFTLTGDGRQHLFVGAGTGIAPLLAMVDELAGRQSRPATLIHGVSYADELVFDDRIRDWQARGLRLDYRPTVSRPRDGQNAGWRGATGRAESELERLVVADGFRPDDAVAYVCGNPPMVGAAVAVLAYAGLRDDAIVVERF